MPGPLDWFMQMLGGQIPAQGGQILQGQNPQGGGYAPNGIASSGPGIMKPPIQQAIMQSPAGAEFNPPGTDDYREALIRAYLREALLKKNKTRTQ